MHPSLFAGKASATSHANAKSIPDAADSYPLVLPTFYNQILHPGQALSLECVASGTPAPALTWLLDGEPVEPRGTITTLTPGSVAADKTVSLTLRTEAAQPEDGGWYKCVASNYLGEDSRTRRADVLGPPHARRMRDRAVVAGHDLWLHCPYSGHPIEDVRWSRAGEFLPVNERQSVFQNGSLLVARVSRSDAGRYECRARSPAGEEAKSQVAITVMGEYIVRRATPTCDGWMDAPLLFHPY